MAHEIVFFPDYSHANPYQRLLYGEAGARWSPRPGSVAEALAAQRLKPAGERVLFHLHWEDAAYRHAATEAAAWQVAQGFLDTLEAFVEAGGAVLWTLHNAAPHDGRYLAVHAELARRLALLADLVHVHSAAGAAFAQETLGLARRRIAIVPHGNYLPLHQPSGEEPACLRRRLGLPPTRRVLLLFGRLGAYKGVPSLLTALAKPRSPELHLIIAGKEVDPLAPALAAMPAERREMVTLRPGFVPEPEVSNLFAAADAVVLPYTRILTSGGVMLALSLARPVIAPAFPGLTETVQDGREALLYPLGDDAGLGQALDRLANLSVEGLLAMQAAARMTAERHDWRHSGLLLDALFHQLLATPKPQRSPIRTPS